jgi:hypothetical protein
MTELSGNDCLLSLYVCFHELLPLHGTRKVRAEVFQLARFSSFFYLLMIEIGVPLWK